jgi:N-acyl-L-homoserine lactone synthetase
MKKANKDYLTKVAQLTEEDRERLFSRMRGKLTRRIEDSKLNLDEAVAIQLELEDEQLQEWRENRVKINQKYKNI